MLLLNATASLQIFWKWTVRKRLNLQKASENLFNTALYNNFAI